jgi:hypothetical protein
MGRQRSDGPTFARKPVVASLALSTEAIHNKTGMDSSVFSMNPQV